MVAKTESKSCHFSRISHTWKMLSQAGAGRNSVTTRAGALGLASKESLLRPHCFLCPTAHPPQEAARFTPTLPDPPGENGFP